MILTNQKRREIIEDNKRLLTPRKRRVGGLSNIPAPQKFKRCEPVIFWNRLVYVEDCRYGSQFNSWMYQLTGGLKGVIEANLTPFRAIVPILSAAQEPEPKQATNIIRFPLPLPTVKAQPAQWVMAMIRQPESNVIEMPNEREMEQAA